MTAFGATQADASGASPQDISSTHATLVAAYKALHGVVKTWPTVEASLRKLNHKFAMECPNVGMGSPQNKSGQRLAYEVAGALWAAAYHTDAGIVNTFINTVSPLRWSDHRIVRRGLKFIFGLHEMEALQVPDLCGDVRLWAASNYNTASADTEQFDRHVEGIDVEIPSLRMFLPSLAPSDKGLYTQVTHLVRRFEELEVTTGQQYWNEVLETLSLNQ
ncbi:MAG TPA: hypothetical protein VGI26_01310 [Solirubrobacteraceae bacterium]